MNPKIEYITSIVFESLSIDRNSFLQFPITKKVDVTKFFSLIF